MGEYVLDLADCLDYLPTVPSGSVDAVICDPPFNTTEIAYDRSIIRWAEIWPELRRVCKQNAAQIFFSAQPFTTRLINSNPEDFRYDLIWDKHMASGFLNANKMPLRSHEIICVFYRQLPTYNPQKTLKTYPAAERSSLKSFANTGSGFYGQNKPGSGVRTDLANPKSILSFHGGSAWDKSKNIHPSQKPTALLEWLVKTYTNPGDTVLDFCAGSGTLHAACLLTGRYPIGCEIDPLYHAKAIKRLEAIRAQPQLFTQSLEVVA